MKAAVLHAIGQPLRYEEVAEPEPGPGELLVRTRACGICGTDLHIVDGWGYVPQLPHILGHEPAGAEVIAVDRGDAPLELALRLGALAALDANEPDVIEKIRAHTDGAGVDAAIDCVGSEQTLGIGVKSLQRGGRLVILGYTQDRYA